MTSVIAPDMVVFFHYTLHSDEGELLDASDDGEPMPYLHGAENIVPGLERAMLDRKVGDKFKVKVAPADGYGERVEGNVVIPRSKLPADVELVPGMTLVAERDDGEELPLWIIDLSDDEVTLDPNHPLAGVNLNFEVEITEIRAATEEEIAHGHPHLPGHHHH